MKHVKNLITSAALLTGSVAASMAMAFTADVPDAAHKKAGGFVGLAVGTSPDYEGSDDYETSVAPFGEYRWESGRYISVGGTGNAEHAARIEANLLDNKTNWQLGPVLQYRLKRDGVDNFQVDNMRKVDAATELGAFLGWSGGKFKLGTTYVTDVSDEHDGSIWYFNGDYDIPINDSFLITVFDRRQLRRLETLIDVIYGIIIWPGHVQCTPAELTHQSAMYTCRGCPDCTARSCSCYCLYKQPGPVLRPLWKSISMA